MRLSLSCLSLVATAALAHTAHADTDTEGGPKSADEATALAVGGSLVGPTLAVAGLYETSNNERIPLLLASGTTMLIGPSLGNWYAGEALSPGLALRTAGVVAATIGFADVQAGLFGLEGVGTGFVLGFVGLGAVTAGAILDIREASHAAHAYNRAHRGTSVSISPIVSRTVSESRTGLALVGSF